MNLLKAFKYSLFFFFCLIISIGKVLGQKDEFRISIHSSHQQLIQENELKFLKDDTLYLRLTFVRKEKIRKKYFVYVIQHDEENETTQVIYPSSDELSKSSIKKEDSLLNIELFSWLSKDQKTDHLSVIITEDAWYGVYGMNIGPRSEMKKLNPVDSSRFYSYLNFIRSDIQHFPEPEDLYKIIEIKQNNLLPVESDLRGLHSIMSAGLILKKTFSLQTTPLDNNNTKTQQFIYKNSLLSKELLLKWDSPTEYIPRDSLMNSTHFTEMMADAAEKHVNLIATRGLNTGISKNFKFSLLEVVETLQQWKEHHVGLLLYSLDKDLLTVLYTDNKSNVDTAQVKLKSDELFDLEGNLKLALQMKSNYDNDLINRGNKLLTSKKKPLLDSLVNIVSKILLPTKFNLHTLDHLVIVPTLNVAAFPFAMLKIKDSILLIDKMSYSIVPSISEFVINGKIQQSSKLGESYYSKIIREGDSIFWSFKKPVLFAGFPESAISTKYSFDELPGTKLEISLLSKKVKEPFVFLGKAATKANILPLLSEANIIYFATHAVADSLDPLNKSFILLSGKDSNAMLTAKEIQQSNMEAFLVVLSACETGLGKAHEGGMIGIARAFELAGAKNVLMSLWQISDSKTPQLMNYFFDEMANEGRGQLFFPHDALRRAVLRFKKENPAALYWAAFSIFGVPL